MITFKVPVASSLWKSTSSGCSALGELSCGSGSTAVLVVSSVPGGFPNGEPITALRSPTNELVGFETLSTRSSSVSTTKPAGATVSFTVYETSTGTSSSLNCPESSSLSGPVHGNA